MKAHEIMTREVISVKPETPVREIAALMTERRISGVPVLGSEGKLLGIVSQSDLLHRKEIGTEARRKWWLRVFSDPDRLAREYSKTHGVRAQDVMTRHVISIKDGAELGEVAAIFDRSRIKRVPVMRDGKMVGLIARSDLVKALSRTAATVAAGSVGDGDLQRVLNDKMKGQPWLDASFVSVIVENGRVQLWGLVSSDDQRQALHTLVEETAGVKNVEDRLSVGRPAMGAI
jgi:CBS domain-containing protein